MSSHLNSMQQTKNQTSVYPSLNGLIHTDDTTWFTCLDGHLKSLVHGLLRLNARREALELLRETFTEIGNETSPEMLIMLASALKNPRVLILLMQAGLDDEAPVLYGETLLHTYTSSRNIPMVRQLLASGIDPERANVYGQTAFFCAAAEGDLELVKVLLSPVVLEKPDNRGVTPLGMAVFNGHLPVVFYLLQQGADHKVRYRKRLLPEIARWRNHEGMVTLLDSIHCVVGCPIVTPVARVSYAEKAPSSQLAHRSKVAIRTAKTTKRAESLAILPPWKQSGTPGSAASNPSSVIHGTPHSIGKILPTASKAAGSRLILPTKVSTSKLLCDRAKKGSLPDAKKERDLTNFFLILMVQRQMIAIWW